MRTYWAVCAVLAAAFTAATAGALAAHPVAVDSIGGLTVIDHPAGWSAAAQHVPLVVVLPLALGFIAYHALSWRRASGERRQQLKWLASVVSRTLEPAHLSVWLRERG